MVSTSSNASRAAAMLFMLGRAGVSGAALKDLAMELGEAKPPVLRCLNSLIEYGFAEQVARGRYRLGPSIFSLARTKGAVEIEVARWRSVLEEVVEQLGQTVSLVRRAGLNVVVVDKQVGTFPIQALVDDIGGRLPMGIGSGSVSILATMDQPDWTEIVRRNSDKYPNWNLDADIVAKHVKKASVQGFSHDVGLLIPECAGLAVPIRERGRYESSLSLVLSVPRSFFDLHEASDVAHQMKNIIETAQAASGA